MAKTLGTPPPEPDTPVPPRKGGGRKAEKRPAGIAATRRIKPAHDSLRKWPFSLVSSGNWELGLVDGKTYFLPDFEHFRDMPGANNVRQRRGGLTPDTRLRDGRITEAERTPIPRSEYLVDVVVEGGEDEKPERYYYLTWEDVVEYPSGAVKVTMDMPAWNAWRFGLVKRGLVTPPTDLVLSLHRTRRESDLGRAQGHPKDSGVAWPAKVERLTKELAILTEAFERTLALAGGV